MWIYIPHYIYISNALNVLISQEEVWLSELCKGRYIDRKVTQQIWQSSFQFIHTL